MASFPEFDARVRAALRILVRDCERKFHFKVDPAFERDLYDRLSEEILAGRLDAKNCASVSRSIVNEVLAHHRGLPPARRIAVPASQGYRGGLSRIQAAYLPLHQRLTFWDADAQHARDSIDAMFRSLEFDHSDHSEQRRAVCIEELLGMIDPQCPRWPSALPSRAQYLGAVRDAVMLGRDGLPATPMTQDDELGALGIVQFSLPDPAIPRKPSVAWFRDPSISVERKLDALVSYSRGATSEDGRRASLTPQYVSGCLRAIAATPNGADPGTVRFLRRCAADVIGKYWWRDPCNGAARTTHLERIAGSYRRRKA